MADVHKRQERLEELALAAGRGDAQAFDELVRDTIAGVAATVAARVPSADLVDEVVQETYVIALQRLGSYRSEGPGVLAWLRGIARYKVIDELRRRQRQQTLYPSLDALAWREEEESLSDEERLPRLRHCLEALPERDRDMLRRRYSEGQSLSLIAQAFKREKGRLAVHLFRLRQALRRCIERAEGLS